MKVSNHLHEDKSLWSYEIQNEIAKSKIEHKSKKCFKIENLKNSLSDLLQTLIQTKYHEDAKEWVSTLTLEQVEEAVLHILSCGSWEELKTHINN